MEKYDLIVIGAGNGGMMCACRASKLGLKVLVIEKHNLPGGAASSFVRGRFEFDASLHEIPDFGEGEIRGELGHLFDDLGIKVEMLPVKDAFRYIVEKDGVRSIDVTFPHGKEKVMNLIREICPEDEEAMEKFFAAYHDMAAGMIYLIRLAWRISVSARNQLRILRHKCPADAVLIDQISRIASDRVFQQYFVRGPSFHRGHAHPDKNLSHLSTSWRCNHSIPEYGDFGILRICIELT